jgi:soluble epoxide hydrolase / lipid-phosphate phosphatase
MDSLEKKTLTTSRGFTFTYYISPPANAQLTLILLHGFPDEAVLWNGVVSKLKPCRLIVPDLLGYAGTSKPTDPVAYNYADHSKDLVEILDAEGIEKVVSIGHDFGSLVAQRLYIHHPKRVIGLVLLNVSYLLPSASPPNLKEVNDRLEKAFGYPPLAYQEFFISDEAPALIMAHLDRFYDAMHGAPRDWFKDIWGARGAIRSWLTDTTRQVAVRGFAQDPALRQRFVERFRRDGLEAPLCYYKATNSDVQFNTTKELSKDDFIVRVPLLYIGCTEDAVCRPEFIEPAKRGGFVPDLEEAMIDCGHWCPLEKPDEVAELINSFLERKLSLASASRTTSL